MRIYDCFMYFDEEVVLDLRLNTLNEFVDYFVIVESVFTHKGEKRELKFNHKKFEKFRKKIIYKVYDQMPKNLETIISRMTGWQLDTFKESYDHKIKQGVSL